MKPFNNVFKTKRKYTKRTYKESDCEVSFNPEFLFAMNLPYATYITYTEI